MKEDVRGYLHLLNEQRVLRQKFMDQDWMQAMAEKRKEDNENKVPWYGRTYVVTPSQYKMARVFWNYLDMDPPRLLGYTLVIGENQ